MLEPERPRLPGVIVDIDDAVRDHYSGAQLEELVLGALAAAGHDLDALAVEDLSGLDQLHAGGVPATEHVLGHLALGPPTPLLDIGCGVGGPSRLAAARHGCPVTGIDLSPDFVALARALTARLGLADRVTHEVGTATALPFDDGAFARAMLIHAGMNIPDKAGTFAEARRVLEPGGLFAVYEQMRIGPGELAYPLPWATDETSSFVETRETYAGLLADAGFELVHEEDLTSAFGPPPPGALTPRDLFGPGFDVRIGNNLVVAAAGTLGAVLMVARARPAGGPSSASASS
jgi:MPBQ/MSBQ methyltransferase